MMKKKMLGLLAAGVALFGINQASAQDYRGAVGFNLGPDMGIGYKQFVSMSSAIELQAAYNIPHHGAMFSAVYQYHIPVATNFKFYFGGGFNIGGLYFNKNDQFAFGLDPTAGFEYKVPRSPIALAIDYKPNIKLANHVQSQWDLAAFKIRFTW